MRRALPAGIVALALLGACTYLNKEPRPPTDAGQWAQARDRVTRSGKIYDQLGANAFVQAVYEEPAEREARVARLAAWRGLSAEERDGLLAAERADAEQYDDFLLSLFTPERADNDLDAPKSVWRVSLLVPGEGEAVPKKISQVKADATLRELYPTIGDFDTVYRVRFPRARVPLTGRPFVLRMAGARGRLELDFGAP